MLGLAIHHNRFRELFKHSLRGDVPSNEKLKRDLDCMSKLTAGRADRDAAVDDFILGRSVDKDCTACHGLPLLFWRPTTLVLAITEFVSRFALRKQGRAE